MKKLTIFLLLLTLVNISLAESVNRIYKLFIYQSNCETYANLYYKLPKENIITVNNATSNLLEITDIPDRNSYSYLNIYIGMLEVCLGKLKANCKSNIEINNEIINLDSIIISNDIFMSESNTRESELPPFKDSLTKLLQKNNFQYNANNILVIENSDLLKQIATMSLDKSKNNPDAIAWIFSMSEFFYAIRFPEKKNVSCMIAFNGCYTSLGSKFSKLLTSLEESNKLKRFILDAIIQEEEIKTKTQFDLLPLNGRSIQSVRNEFNDNLSASSFNKLIKSLAITKYCLDKFYPFINLNINDNNYHEKLLLKFIITNTIDESVDTILSFLEKEFVNNISSNIDKIIVTGDLLTSDVISKVYKETFYSKIDADMRDKISILSTSEIMPWLILATEKFQVNE